MARNATVTIAVAAVLSGLDLAAAAQKLSPYDVNAMPSKPADARVAYGRDPLQFGDLRLPAGKGPFPVVVVIHGGCWRSIANLDNTAPMADALRDAGVATWPGTDAFAIVKDRILEILRK